MLTLLGKASKAIAFTALCTFAFGACSVISAEDIGLKRSNPTQSGESSSDTVHVQLKVVDEDSAVNLDEPTFALAAATGFTFDVLGCRSGFTATNLTSTASSAPVALYAHDRDCFFDLKEFQYGGAIYLPVAGTSFFAGTTFSASRVAYFVNQANAADKFKVRIQDVLASPLLDAGQFTYMFMQIKKGADFSVLNYSYTETMQVLGSEAPNVFIQDMNLAAIDGTTGQATFTTTLQCNMATTVHLTKKSCPVTVLTQHHLEDFKSILITEPADPTTFDYDAARALFDLPGNAALIHSVSDGVVVTANRFAISNKQQNGPLHTNKVMYLVVQYKDPTFTENRSYRYFKVTIGNPTL